jgi:hypothetical protein
MQSRRKCRRVYTYVPPPDAPPLRDVVRGIVEGQKGAEPARRRDWPQAGDHRTRVSRALHGRTSGRRTVPAMGQARVERPAQPLAACRARRGRLHGSADDAAALPHRRVSRGRQTCREDEPAVKSYAERQIFHTVAQAIWADAVSIIDRVSDRWGNEVRCHELARAALTALPRACRRAHVGRRAHVAHVHVQ